MLYFRTDIWWFAVYGTKKRFNAERFNNKGLITIIKADLLGNESLKSFSSDIDAVYYLVHSMSSNGEFSAMEEESAKNLLK